MLVRLVAVLMLLSMPAGADPADGAIDFDALFAAQADLVEAIGDGHGSTRWRLTLPGPVVVWADGTEDARRYTGLDESPAGSVGCLWSVYSEIAALEAACPGLLSAQAARELAQNHRRVGQFVAANTFPPVTFDVFWQYWSDRLRTAGPAECPAQLDPGAAGVIGTVTAPGFAAALESILATPRLPVGLPCI